MGTYTQFAAKVIRANGHGKPVAYRVSGTGKWAIALPSTVGLHDPLRDRIATVLVAMANGGRCLAAFALGAWQTGVALDDAVDNVHNFVSCRLRCLH